MDFSFANQVVDECASTNDLARALGEAGYPHGSWVSTKRQGSGRGRLGRSWSSLEGNLFLSLIVRVEDRNLWTWIPLATALGVAEALPDFEIRIKWPNDLWLNGAKLGGILCEAVGTRSDSFIVVGVGLNSLTHPEGLDQKTTSLGIHVDQIRPQVIQGILGVMNRLQEFGSEAVRVEYEKRAAFPEGTEIEWNEGDTGAVQRLGPSGELKVRKADGSVISLYAEDVKVRPKIS